MSIDYRRAFVRALYEQMCETYDAHGIESVYEDEFVELAAELMREYLEPTIREFREEQGLVGSVVPKGRLLATNATAPQLSARWRRF